MIREQIFLYFAATIFVVGAFPAKSFDLAGIDKDGLSGSKSIFSSSENQFVYNSAPKRLFHNDIQIRRERRNAEIVSTGIQEPLENFLSPVDFKTYSAQFNNNIQGGKVKADNFEEVLEKTIPYDSTDFS